MEDVLTNVHCSMTCTWPWYTWPHTHPHKLTQNRRWALTTQRQRDCMHGQSDRWSVSQSDAAAAVELVVIILQTRSPETVNGSLACPLSSSTAAWLTVSLSACIDDCFPLLLLTSSCFRLSSSVYTRNFSLINLLTGSLRCITYHRLLLFNYVIILFSYLLIHQKVRLQYLFFTTRFSSDDAAISLLF